MDNGYPGISDYARGMLVKGKYIDYTEVYMISDNMKSYPQYDNYKPDNFAEPVVDHLQLFPNPAGDFVIVYYNTSEYSAAGILHIANMQGVVLKTIELNNWQNQLTLNIGNIPNGIYLVSLFVQGSLVDSKKLVKGSQ